jgi:hypothetical protein
LVFETFPEVYQLRNRPIAGSFDLPVFLRPLSRHSIIASMIYSHLTSVIADLATLLDGDFPALA